MATSQEQFDAIFAKLAQIQATVDVLAGKTAPAPIGQSDTSAGAHHEQRGLS